LTLRVFAKEADFEIWSEDLKIICYKGLLAKEVWLPRTFKVTNSFNRTFLQDK